MTDVIWIQFKSEFRPGKGGLSGIRDWFGRGREILHTIVTTPCVGREYTLRRGITK